VQDGLAGELAIYQPAGDHSPTYRHIFRGTSSLGGEEPWIGRLGLGVGYGLELDRVPPVITNVVNILELRGVPNRRQAGSNHGSCGHHSTSVRPAH
jgi:hypothetical protein